MLDTDTLRVEVKSAAPSYYIFKNFLLVADSYKPFFDSLETVLETCTPQTICFKQFLVGFVVKKVWYYGASIKI